MHAYPGPGAATDGGKTQGNRIESSGEPMHVHISDRNGQNETKVDTNTWSPLKGEELTRDQAKWLKSLSAEEKTAIQKSQNDVYNKGTWSLTDVLRTIRDMNQKGKEDASSAKTARNGRSEGNGQGNKGNGAQDGTGWENLVRRIVRSAKGMSDEN